MKSGTKIDESTKLKFTSFFRNLVVELDREVYGPDHHLAEWYRTASTEENDGFTVRCTSVFLTKFLRSFCLFQITRPGDGTIKCTILMMLNHQVKYDDYHSL